MYKYKGKYTEGYALVCQGDKDKGIISYRKAVLGYEDVIRVSRHTYIYMKYIHILHT